MSFDRPAVGDGPFGSDPPPTDHSVIDAAIADAGAVGFVAVGGRFDADLRYLTRVEGPEREYAFVRVPGRSVLCAPDGYVQRAEAQFDGEIAADRVGDPAGARAAGILDTAREDADADVTDRSVLVPPTIPHDAAVYLERAGYDLQSTTTVGDARVVKTISELDAIRAVQEAATAAVREVERLLATADVGDDGEIRSEGNPLTAERLRRATNAELAHRGVTGAGNTVVGAGTDGVGTDGRSAGPDRRFRAGEPVVVAVAPRGPHGYHGSLSRTFVADSDGGWERRAYVAVESALAAVLDAIEAGAIANAVGREADAELAAFGFDPAADSATDGPSTPGHGVGLSRWERPSLRDDTELAAGQVLAVEPQVADPERGVVRLSALVAVRPDGYERLDADDRSFQPRP